MAVYKITNFDEYVCDSDDTKPTPLGVGAKLTELNTGQKWIWAGDRWVEDLSMYYAVRSALEDVA
jgi:hypothetical protein